MSQKKKISILPEIFSTPLNIFQYSPELSLSLLKVSQHEIEIVSGGVEMFSEVSEIFSRGVGIFSLVLKLSLFSGIERFFWRGKADIFLKALRIVDLLVRAFGFHQVVGGAIFFLEVVHFFLGRIHLKISIFP